MKISYNWLKQYINLDVSPSVVSKVLTDTGLEVEGAEDFQSVKGGLAGVIVGEVLTCRKHENADKLSITTVDIGGGTVLPIVCGAPNVAVGQKVLVATVGTRLYSGDDSFEIKKSKIRGEVSEGMICAEDELGLGSSHDGIMVLPDEVEKGMSAADYFMVERDTIFEIGLTPNRSDAVSHIGVARDLAAGLNREFNTRKYKLSWPDVDSFAVDNHALDIEVKVNNIDACPRYVGITLCNIQVKESPEWLQSKLKRIGVRPINNIVDITNFVLHETGQPLHAFDADKIAGNLVVVDSLPSNATFITLDGEERKLHHDDLMICNAEGGMCIAGVFGGLTSGVTTSTKNIFLESACFNARSIRKTSKRHGLQTDASFRFERGVDPNIALYALKRAILLMQEVAGGSVASEIKDIYPSPVVPAEVEILYAHVDRLIGKSIDREVIKTILDDLELKLIKETSTSLTLAVPTFKVDVTREVDVIEEILRIYGINNVDTDGKLHSSLSFRQKPDAEKVQQLIADYLVAQGMVEMMNNSLTRSAYAEMSKYFDNQFSVHLLNPLSRDLNVLRQSLLFGGLETVAYNLNRKVSDLKLFEFGTVYSLKENFDADRGVKNFNEEKHLILLGTGKTTNESWYGEAAGFGFFDMKGWVEAVISRLGLDRKNITIEDNTNADFSEGLTYNFLNKELAFVGSVHAGLLKSFDIRQEVLVAIVNWSYVLRLIAKKDIQYTPVPKFPSVRRDLALLLDKSVRFSDLRDAAFKAERNLLQAVSVFDIYQGDKIPADKKSYALSFILEDKDKTLTDKVIEKSMARIAAEMERQFGAALR